MKKIDFINYISLFKEIKIKIEKFCNKIYTEFIENPQAQAILPELIQHAQAYNGLSEEEFLNNYKNN